MQTTYIDLPKLHLAISKKEKRTSDHAAVRELCRLLLKRLNWDDSVDETSLPYRLTHAKNMVSYSHSNQRVAVVIAKNNAATHDLVGLGVDVEDNDVSMKVAKRFFAPSEVEWLETLESSKKQQATNLLWMAKEAYIKANNGKLLSGLKLDLADFTAEFDTPELTINLNNSTQLMINTKVNFALCTTTNP